MSMTEEAEESGSEEEEALETSEGLEEKRKAKPREAKREKKKKEERGASSYYKIEGGQLTRLQPFCERCGPGYFMANHGNRYTCGHCGFTRYKQDR